jgi:cytochrome c biogenesis protein CcmG, thiol:disulfide interchange protein DsbE
MKTGVTVILLCGFAIFSVMVKNELREEKSPLRELQIGTLMPEFSLTDPAGNTVALHNVTHENKLTVINFWASWCEPCRVEMPGLEKLYASRKGDGLTILAINEDEERGKMEAYLTQKRFSFPVLMDHDGVLMKQVGVRGLPTTVLVGGDGRIKMVTEGLQQYLSFMIDAQLKANNNVQVGP